MKVRYLGHSCVEIIGQHHIVIDPDFTRQPMAGVEFICVSHAHKDHLGKVAELPGGIVLASADVCEIAFKMGVPRQRLHPVAAGQQVENIKVLPGFSVVKDFMHTLMNLLIRRRLPDAGGTPLSFFVQDEASLLHVGDAHKVPLKIQADILCLPWRTSPINPENYKSALLEMAKQMAAPYLLPIHYDLAGMEADPAEICSRIEATVLLGEGWHLFNGKKLVSEK